MNSETFTAFQKLFEFSKQNATTIKLGTGTTHGSFGPVFRNLCPRTIFTLRTNGNFSFNFQWLDQPEAAAAFRKSYLEKMKEIGFDLSEEDLDKYPTYSMDEWAPKADQLILSLKALLPKP